MKKERSVLTQEDNLKVSSLVIDAHLDPYIQFTGCVTKPYIKRLIDTCLKCSDFRSGLDFFADSFSLLWAQRQDCSSQMKQVLKDHFSEFYKLYFRQEGIYRTSRKSLAQGLVNRPDRAPRITKKQMESVGIAVKVICARQERWEGEKLMEAVEPNRWEDDGGK